jgi:hypothetical protein
MTVRDIAFQASELDQPLGYGKLCFKASYIVKGIDEVLLLLV